MALTPDHPVWHQFGLPDPAFSRQDWLTASLRDAIVTGSLRPGARLPATRRLATEIALSRNTVSIAYDRLLAEGLLEAKVGAGTFVTETLTRPQQVTSVPPSRRLAQRALDILPRPGERPRADAARPLTPGLPDLSLFPHEVWGRLMARYWRQRPTLGYENPAGLLTLRQAVAGYIGATRGVGCHPDQVMITNGTQGAIHAVVLALLEPGESTWLENPGYRQMARALFLGNARPVAVPVDEQGLSVAAGMALAPQARLAIVSPSHQYPTGVTMSLARRIELLDWAQQSDAWIIEDDYDGEYRYEGAPVKALKSLDRDGRVIYVGTFSKLLAPGLRLGFMVLPDALIDPMRAVRDAIDLGVGTPSQAVFAEFIGNGHLGAHIRRSRAAYDARRQLVLKACESLPGVIGLSGTEAGLHLLCRLRQTPDQAVVALARERGLGVAALSGYRQTLAMGERAPAVGQGLVIGYANAACDVLEESLSVLAQCLRDA